MPRPRFEKLPEDRRRLILEAAAREFGEHGFDGASYNRIIAHCGTSKGAMYYYFDDKADLYATVLDDAVTRVFAALGPIPDGGTAEDFWAWYDQMFRRMIALSASDPVIVGLMRTMAAVRTAGNVAGSFATLEARTMAWMAELVRRGQSVGAIRTDLPTELLVRVVRGIDEAVDGWIAEHFAALAPDDLERTLASTQDLVWRVCAPGPLRKGARS